MEKVMKYVNMNFWEKLFRTISKLNFGKKPQNILDYHIMDTNLHNNEENTYIKICSTCLMEEDGIIHKLLECAPILYVNEVICKATVKFTGINITNKSSQRKPDELTRFILFLDAPSATRKQRNKETERLTNALAAILSVASATARKMWIQDHIRKPDIMQTQNNGNN